MIHAYDKSYLDDVMSNLGTMMEYGIRALGLTAEEMYSRFISSGIAGLIEMGHPRYLAGLSGIELALAATGLPSAGDVVLHPGPEYWAGWALARLQWETGYSFAEFPLYDLGMDKLIQMFVPYHEADITKFIQDAGAVLRQSRPGPSLKRIRKAAGLSQQELAELSGISLRAIRSYEQNSRSLLKAESGTLLNLSKVLGCRMEKLLY